ncbi:Glycosyltransferase involved in cell wall bisynthesis [Malonomonas rubra DSM 5091]|uniref:Glycosyltransferase involved in cell wall bisynthesis n=2 Tax=Malonomonas rubra TaxID=57040 RepID=A0A1M6DRD5_MALRU|nr:Glycosyltransferase involved in cell wall bisynthesis [Malonomonas rubra DSM 5091]
MVVACADSPLLQARASIPMAGEFDVVWFSDSESQPEATCKVVHHMRQPSLGPLYWLRLILVFFNTYFKKRPDILHVHWSVFLPLLFPFKWKKVIVSPMGSDIFHPGKLAFRQRISRKVLSRADVVTSKSEFMDAQLLLLGVPKERIVRMTWGVEDAFFTAPERRGEMRSRFSLTEEELVFFSPRAIKPLYRIDEIVAAFCQFRKNSGAGLLLVSEMAGTAEDRERLAGIVKGYGLSEHVRFLGQLDLEGMTQAYAVSDAVISFSLSDGMPQTLYETMAAGCYPVFTDLAHYHSLIASREEGYLCSSTDAGQLVEAMQYVKDEISGKWNPADNREKIRRLASRKTETEKMLGVYQRLLQV